MTNVINPEMVEAFMTPFLKDEVPIKTPENISNDDANIGNHSEASESGGVLVGTEEWIMIQKSVVAIKKIAKTTGIKIVGCEICHKDVTVKNYKKHLILHTGIKNFTCEICGKGFTQNSTLKYHMKDHMEVKGFTCDNCSKEFKCKTDLRRHMAIHMGLKEFKCHLCVKEFAQKDSLSRHIQLIHVGNKEFICPVCGKAFSLKTYMMTHLKTHKEVKDFKCPMCDREFACSSNMKRHIATHKKPKFPCNICGEVLSCKTNFKIHILQHNKVMQECETCGKKFTRKGALEKHLAGHEVAKTKGQLSEAPLKSDSSVAYKRYIKIEVPSNNDDEDSTASSNDVPEDYLSMVVGSQLFVKCEIDDDVIKQECNEFDEYDNGES